MTKIYEQHDAAFRGVSAYVIAKDGERVATIAFKHGNACTAYVHWLGLEMVRGRATGYGYDKASAACREAAVKIAKRLVDGPWLSERERYEQEGASLFAAALMEGDRGAGWNRCLREAGFQVWGAIA